MLLVSSLETEIWLCLLSSLGFLQEKTTENKCNMEHLVSYRRDDIDKTDTCFP